MKIKNRFTGELIFSADVETMKECLLSAIKSRANLSGAYLYGAKGINKHITTPLFGMLDIEGKIRGYKLVDGAMEGPMNGGIRYSIGESFEVKDACTDEFQQCASGINLNSLDWVCREWKPGYKILIAEFEKKDIAAIPVCSDGKFRVFRCKIVAEKSLKELGLET